MGRKKDVEKHALREKLGLSPAKNWTREEILAMEKRQIAKEAAEAEKEALTTIIAGAVPTEAPANLEIPFEIKGHEDPFSGLTERQKRIARLRMRGLSQGAISHLEGISQPFISQELKKIKEWQAERGGNVDQHVVVGITSTLYEEVEQMAWQMYYTPEITVSEKAKCLAVVMAAREKHTRLLMDLGLIKKVGAEVKVTHEVSPFLAHWKDRHKKDLADSLVAEQLKALPEPEPENVVDAEFEETMADDEDLEIVTPKTDLAEPTLDDVEIDDG